MQIDLTDRSFLKRFAWFAIAAAMSTIALELIADLFTQSVGLLSDAMESGVSLIGPPWRLPF